MDHEIDFEAIRVPIHWAGMEKPLADGRKVWCCGACPDPDDCVANGVCSRAVGMDVLGR